MSNMGRSDTVDDLVASVRHLVATEPAGQGRKMPSLDRLVLTPALRVDQGDDADIADQPQPDDDVSAATPATDDDLTDLAAMDGADLTADTASVPDQKAAPSPETQMIAETVMQDIGGRIDDAALRDAVLRVLHEELSGEMGERITRNVRKLVRREINRILTSRDFD